jgi:hypothetical protein
MKRTQRENVSETEVLNHIIRYLRRHESHWKDVAQKALQTPECLSLSFERYLYTRSMAQIESTRPKRRSFLPKMKVMILCSLEKMLERIS